MESCDLLDSDWEKWGLWGDSLGNNDIFDFTSSLDQSLTSGLENVVNNDAKSDVFAKWMDEKMDLSIMHLEGQSSLLDDLNVMIEDPATFLDIMMDTPPEMLENGLEFLNLKLDKNNNLATSEFVSTPDSPGGRVPDSSPALSPECHQESFYKSVSPENPSTPVNEISREIDHLKEILKETEVGCLDSTLSPNFNVSQLSPSTSVTSIETLDSVDSKYACNSIQAPASSPITENSYERYNIKINFDSKQTDIVLEEAKVRTIKTRSQNHKKLASGRSSTAGECRRERKRKQNKDAATRYRQKKRKESVNIKSEENVLEDRNKELKSKVQQLSNEISYLKGLLKEAKLRMLSTDCTPKA